MAIGHQGLGCGEDVSLTPAVFLHLLSVVLLENRQEKMRSGSISCS